MNCTNGEPVPLRLLPSGGHGNALEIEVKPLTPTQFILPEFRMEEDAEYELSFLAKVNRQRHSLVLRELLDGGRIDWSGGSRYGIGPEWTRVVHRFRTVKKIPCWSSIFLSAWCQEDDIDADGTGPRICIADLRLGRAGAPEPSPDMVTASVKIAEPPKFHRFDPGETISFLIDFVNLSKEKKQISFKLQAKVRGTERILASSETLFEVPPGNSRFAMALPMPELNAVWTVSGKAGGVRMVNFVRLATVKPARIKRGELPVDLGINSFATRSYGGGIDREEAEFFADAGISYVRFWETDCAFKWAFLEQADNQFDYRYADAAVAVAEAAGLSVIPVVGDMFLSKPGGPPERNEMRFWQHLPPWIFSESELARTFTFPAWKGYRAWLPPKEKFARLVRNLASRYRGRITVWEILNESSSHIAPQDYREYLKIAWDILKNDNPENMVLGGGLTGDFGLDMKDHLLKQMEIGVFRYVDGIVTHPYEGVFEDSQKSSDTMAEVFQSRCREFKIGLPFWNTELYYLNPDSRGGVSHDIGPEFSAGYLARRHILDAVYGWKASILLPGAYYMGTTMNDGLCGPCRTARVLCAYPVPNERYLVSAAFAHLLKNTKYAGKMQAPSGFRIYKFSGETKAVFTIHALHIREGEQRTLKLSSGPEYGDVKIFDEYGNRVSAGALNASPLPLYATGPDAATLERFFKAIQYRF
ncbi:MAG: hypothetical protein HPZ91_02860 [Lentisphaeria bacterium]|nr:hypothetical protein [Lentisphaeria bacterium]